jgi:DNA-directed RNA polymerase II subunit RPB2
MDNATLWKIIDSHFNDNPQALVRHHLDSYNDFYKTSIYQIFKEKNPIRLYSKLDPKTNEYRRQCNLYMGGKNGDKLYFGKPVINDDNNAHYMYPNEARLRNMTYGMTIHYDVDIEYIDYLNPGEAPSVIGEQFVKEVKGGAISTYSDMEYAEGGDADTKLENYKTKGGDLMDQDGSKQSDKQGGGGKEGFVQAAELTSSFTGGAPKATTIRKRNVKPKELVELTPGAAARLREATEESIAKGEDGGIIQRQWHTLDKIYLGKFPIMLQSDFCILQGLDREVRHTMGECRNDLGGYFVIDGKEKTVVAQEKFADNMLYVRKMGKDDEYLYAADIRSVSENVSKPVRTLSVRMVAPTPRLTNRNIVVNIPNVRKPVPLFIVFRALGVISDKDIIRYCLLDLEKFEPMVDLFAPSVHDAGSILCQQTALRYIGLLTKGKTVSHALEILADYLLPHVGEINYIAKAYALGNMVFRLLAVSTGQEPPTDRDNFKYKRIELVGSLLYDLFREYWSIQLRNVHLAFEKILYYNEPRYENNLFGLIMDNYSEVFRERSLEQGFKKAFKGNWGAHSHTKRIGIIQDLNRLSFNSALNHLRKTNLPLDSGVKLVGPRVLHSSHWGYMDPIDTPDGASIGLHKHLAITTYITRGTSREPLIEWLREQWGMKQVEESSPTVLSNMTKVIVNGFWAGSIEQPLECLQKFRMFRRNALIPVYISASFDIAHNTIYMYTDAGRLTRPIFYMDETTGRPSYQSKAVLKRLQDGAFSWADLVSGFNPKRASANFDLTQMRIYALKDLYEGIQAETNPAVLDRFIKDKAILDYIDCSESENAMISFDHEAFEQQGSSASSPSPSPSPSSKGDSNKDLVPGTKRLTKYTHCEIHNALILGMMCNMIIFPENNPASRNSFSCGQSKQAASMYHTNFQVRMDKTAVVLNYGQMPLVKSRFLDPIMKEENPYGENAIVAIMCYTGYNVEDAILLNEGAVKRGLFRTSYFSTYEAHEESTKNAETIVDKRFMDIQHEPSVLGTKPGYDYSRLDKHGIIKEGTPVDDKTVLIGLASTAGANGFLDGSKTPKKGQLGIVDRAFITEGEEGYRIAKVRILEQRIPTLGDKMASRAGQKGVVGLVIPERDMPFTAEGIRPDMIINPHALPTRMTIGQLVECITGKACAALGGFGDCTAFQNDGSKIGVFGSLLTKQGFHSSGNEVLYNGMTGEQLEMEIFMGPTYYMRLKHMVKDKINYRALGPRTALTKQPVSGRANDGGLRIGEMERDSVIGHGISEFLRESMMERGDKSYLAICNTTGLISIYNPSKGLFMSPMADGPLRFTGSLESEDFRLEHITQFGRSFSIVCIPYSFKLLVQELQTINVQMRIITEDNIEQIANMSYSNNLDKLLKQKGTRPEHLIDAIKKTIAKKTGWKDEIKTPTSTHTPTLSIDFNTPPIIETSPAYVPSPGTVDDYLALGTVKNDESPVYNPRTSEELESDDEVFGGSKIPLESGNAYDDRYVTENPFQVGSTVLLRGQTGGAARRPWSVSHVGDKFATIKALDPQGLSEDQQIRVVNLSEIFPASSVVQSPIHDLHTPHDVPIYQNPYDSMIPMMPTPTIVVAPKFFNGNGNDQSTNMGQPQLQPQVMDTAMNGQPTGSLNNLTITDLITGSSSKKNDESTPPTNTNKSISGDIDFTKPLIITKKS